MSKPKILFVFDHKYETFWADGLWAAVEILRQDFVIEKINLFNTKPYETTADFILGWGGWNSRVDKMLQGLDIDVPKGLCIAGNSFPPDGKEKYNVLFYETEWYKPQIEGHSNIFHAFGVNTDIYWHSKNASKIWDWLTVGAFALWKRQPKIQDKKGTKLAIGEIQKENYGESLDIIANLILKGVAISDMVEPTTLAKIYNASRNVYIPADINGGGERAVMEAKACGIPVIVESDNPKLMSLLQEDVPTHHYYADQLRKGVMTCL